MLVLLLASFLAAPSNSGQPWAITLRPAVVVQASETEAQPEAATVDEAPEASQEKPPRLAPAKTEKPKSKPSKSGSRRSSASSNR